MFDFTARNKRFAQVILALLTLPFAFFGIDYYFRGGAQEGDVARVGKDTISRAEFDNALRDQQERARQALGRSFDPSMFESPEVRAQILDQVVAQRLLHQKSRDESFVVSNQQLEQFIRSLPVFQDNGRFSFDRYREAIQAQGMSQPQFEARLRQDLALRPLEDPFGAGSIVSRAYVRRILELADEKREVELARLPVDPYLSQVKVDDAQTKAFYDANTAAFQVPEQAKIEYLVLSLDSIAEKIAVDPSEVRQQYDQNLKQYGQSEQRQASHILVAVPKDAKPEERAAAKKKAEELLAQARANPDRFAELAKQYSQDPGSKDQGGDLGYISRGTMVKPFEDAVFSMKAGEIGGPVETDFGYHVIRLVNVKGEGARPFDEVKGQIEQELRRQKAAKRFAEVAEQFQNLVYEQADSLAGAEKALNEKGASVKVERTDWLTRQQVQALVRDNARFVQALFSPDSVQAKRNTEAIEIAPNTLVAGRIVEYKPAAPRPFAEVKAAIEKQLQLNSASELAQKAGAEALAQLRQGKPAAGVEFSTPLTVTRAQRQEGLTENALKELFAVDAGKLPAYVGATNERGGYTIVKVLKSIPATPEAERIEATRQRVAEQLGREQFSAYVAGLREKADVRVNQANLERR